MNGRHDHTTAVYGGQRVLVWSECLLDLGTDFLVGNMVFVRDALWSRGLGDVYKRQLLDLGTDFLIGNMVFV